jgi:hypothetical protein
MICLSFASLGSVGMGRGLYFEGSMQFFSVGAQARGFIAIGADAEGVIALGQVSRGVIAIGQMATGVVAIGQLARGVFVIGQLGVGVWAYGQGGVGIARAVGMLAVAARAGGMLPLSLWPESRKKDAWKPGRVATVREVLDGVVSEGWIEAELALEGASVALVVDGQRYSDCEIPDTIADDVRAHTSRRGWVLIERREQLSSAGEGGFREAPERAVKLAVLNTRWPKPEPIARRVWGAIGIALVSALVTWVSLLPAATVVAGLVSGR